MSVNAIKSDEKKLEQRINDAQILFDEADDIPFVKAPYENELGLYLLSPSGALAEPERMVMAKAKLKQMGFDVTVDKAASHKWLRFAGTDQERAKSFSRAAKHEGSTIVMPTRGGYGLTRILPHIDWKLLQTHPKTYVGYSDFTAFNLALLAKTGIPSYTGPNAVGDFGGDMIDDLTAEVFVEVLRGELEMLSFIAPDADPVDAEGILWGGNLAMVATLVGTPYLPTIKKGILFLEDVDEHPYRIERLLTQLLHAGILDKQKAIMLGDFSHYKLSRADNGYDLSVVIKWLRKQVKVPVITGLPYGHGDVRLTLPIGKKVGVATQEGMAYLVFEAHPHSEAHREQTEHQRACGLDGKVKQKKRQAANKAKQAKKLEKPSKK